MLLENNEVILGNNQENAAYPSGLCAERVAAFYAGANYPGVGFKALAIVAGSSKTINNEPIAPCGACRQVLAEYELKQEKDLPVYFSGETGNIIKAPSVKVLLPYLFSKKFL